VAGGTERQVLDGIVNRAFVVLEGGIYYIGRPEGRLYPPAVLSILDRPEPLAHQD